MTFDSSIYFIAQCTSLQRLRILACDFNDHVGFLEKPLAGQMKKKKREKESQIMWLDKVWLVVA